MTDIKHKIRDKIRVIQDFPQPGVRFKDITTLLKDGPTYQQAIDLLSEQATTKGADLIVGPEARGFVIGAPLAYKLGKGFVPIRKAGKLPAKSIQAEYDLEYGKDALAIHEDAISPGQKIIIADDLLATGGTIQTTIKLIEQLGGAVVSCLFLIELTYLDGRRALGDQYDVYSLVHF